MDEIARRDLKSELLRAEREALDKKRKAAGLAPLPDDVEQTEPVKLIQNGTAADDDQEAQARKRRKILEEAAELDKDDSSDEEDGTEANGKSKGKGKEKATDNAEGDDENHDDEDSDSDDDSDEEDDTAALMAELNKIKQERAEEKVRQEREAAASASVSREAEIATGNPLLNLQAALGQAPTSPGSSVSGRTSTAGSFAVKRRWDDDLIFKNQASGIDIDGKPKKEFVNDLLRTDFHRKFMAKFIK